jgi:hypothetical protein
VRAERRCCREWRRGVQKPLAVCQGKAVPGAVLLVAAGRSVPGGPPRPPGGGKSRKRTAAGGRRRGRSTAAGAVVRGPTNTVGHRARSSGSCGGGRRRCLVAECSAALSVLENCSRKVLGGISGESKNWPDEMSGEPSGGGAIVFSGCCAEAQEDPRKVVDPVPRSAAGAEGVLQMAVEAFYHPV